MTDAPAPLIDGDVDLRDFDYMPLYGDRLLSSDTWLSCNSDEQVAALRLWWKSWHQEPAGSLPNDDRLLAHLAGYGVAVKEFQKIKANAMLGWILCSDGRLYHPIVCKIAETSWAGKKKKATEKERDRERKRRKNESIPPEQVLQSGGNNASASQGSGGNPPEIALKGSEGKVPSSLHSDGPPVAPQIDPPEIAQAIVDYNALAEELGLPQAQRLTANRKSKLRARLKDVGGIEGWRAALEKVRESAFLRGENDSGWKANLDFLLRESSLTKVMEGSYAGVPRTGSPWIDAAKELRRKRTERMHGEGADLDEDLQTRPPRRTGSTNGLRSVSDLLAGLTKGRA